MTADEFLEMPDPQDGTKQELVKGEVVSTPISGFEHGRVQGNTGALILQFVRSVGLGRAALGSGVITERNPDTVRGPDVSYYSKVRLPLHLRVIGYHDRPPDLCVEVLSPWDTAAQLRDKLKEYFAAGVRMVWIVDPEDRSITVFTQPDQGQTLYEPAEISGGDVLPGFSCRVSELFEE